MTNIWLTAVSRMFFCESRGVAQLMLRCIMSWSSPVMAISNTTPARNIFQK